jgi:Uma2 family endonuclease
MSQAFDKPTAQPEPAWEVGRLFPDQGSWTEADYLNLDTNKLIEFADGIVEVLPMPTFTHQLIMLYLHEMLKAFASPRRLGVAVVAPFRVRLWEGRFREPDVAFMLAAHDDRTREAFWEGADLVMEVVSNENRRHDLETKRHEYARAGIAESWIIDPREEEVHVLTLHGDAYQVAGVYRPGDEAASRLLPGFRVATADVLSPPRF